MPFWVVLSFWWSYKARPWLQKNWMWVVLPVGIIAYLLSLPSRKVVVIESGKESNAAKEFERKIEERKAEALDELDLQLVEQTEKVVKEHTKTIQDLTQAQRQEADELLDNPDALRNYLISVGQRARS